MTALYMPQAIGYARLFLYWKEEEVFVGREGGSDSGTGGLPPKRL